ncbi:MAG: CDP-glycerol glycerophosphotransferase family protein, partial [Bacteroidota bacterium]
LSHCYVKFCVASEGFKELFVAKGISPNKIVATGIPNFDNAQAYKKNDFPQKGYVLAATSCLRETFKYENRRKFIQKALKVADGRQLIFKLHPNEQHDRAIREIEQYAPGCEIYTKGNIQHMIANCSALITKYSSVLMVALGLDKPVYSDLPDSLLQKMRPIQNKGRSANNIAAVCRSYLVEEVPQYQYGI